MDDDRLVIEKILAGDLKAFRILIESHQRLVSHIVFRMVANRSAQEEICQEVFIKVYENLSKFNFQSKLSTWIGKIAYNMAINHLRKNKIPLYEDSLNSFADDEKKTVEDSLSENVWGKTIGQPDELLANENISSIVQTEISHLPAHYRTVLTLYHLDELSYREIGEILNLPNGTVKSCLFRARKLLKDKLLAKYELEELWP